MNIDTIWQNYRASLRGFLASKISNPEDVDDLLQDVLIKIYQNIDSLSSKNKLKAWIFQIANRVIIDFYRKQAGRLEISIEELWHEENEENAHALTRCITPFIQSLPEKQRDLLLATEVYGQSQKEYAEQHKIPYSTLKSRVTKSRQALRERFKQCCKVEMSNQNKRINCTDAGDDCNSC
jgi:RNA polymerase sigma-70 factor (ECF subfamily)